MAASLGVLLWHGGYRSPAQWLLAAGAAAGIAVVRPLPRAGVLQDPLVAALAVTALANLASLAWHHGQHSSAPALAAVAVALTTAVAARAVRAGPRTLCAVVLAVAVTCGTAGLAGLLFQAQPLAERIDGLWRAGGTLEYPPALGLLAVCGLAAALALHADGVLDRTAGIVACAVLAAAVLGSFDRVAVLELASVLVLFAVRVPGSRAVVAATAVVAVLAAGAAIAVADPGRGSLERHLRHGPLTSRRTVWRASWDMARDRPWLGYGPGARPAQAANRIVLEAATPAEAHDAPLQQWLAAGVVAAAGTALALGAMLLGGLGGLASAAPARIAAGAAATAVAVSGLYDFTWSFAPLLLLGALSALACRESAG